MIARMEKVLLAGRSRDRRAVLEALRQEGVVHVERLEHREQKALPATRDELALVDRALEILGAVEGAADSCPPEHTPPVVVERILALAAALKSCEERRTRLRTERRLAAPWDGSASRT